MLQCLYLPAEGGDGQALGFVSLELPERQQCTLLVPVFISSILIVLKILNIHKLSALGLPPYGKSRSTTFYLYLLGKAINLCFRLGIVIVPISKDSPEICKILHIVSSLYVLLLLSPLLLEVNYNKVARSARVKFQVCPS